MQALFAESMEENTGIIEKKKKSIESIPICLGSAHILKMACVLDEEKGNSAQSHSRLPCAACKCTVSARLSEDLLDSISSY